MPGPKVWPGKPYPLGATWDGKGVNFALFSAHAERVELCLFDRSGMHEEARIPLPAAPFDAMSLAAKLNQKGRPRAVP